MGNQEKNLSLAGCGETTKVGTGGDVIRCPIGPNPHAAYNIYGTTRLWVLPGLWWRQYGANGGDERGDWGGGMVVLLARCEKSV